MSIPFDATLSVSSDALFREFDGEAVILNLSDESYYGLDDTGTQMWKELTTEGTTIGAAFDRLLAAYEVDSDKLRSDLTDLIAKLVEKGILEVVSGETASV